MRLADIKASHANPVYVNLTKPGIVGNYFYSNLKWDGEYLYERKHDMYCTNHGWVGGVELGMTDITSDRWQVMSDGPIPLNHPFGTPLKR